MSDGLGGYGYKTICLFLAEDFDRAAKEALVLRGEKPAKALIASIIGESRQNYNRALAGKVSVERIFRWTERWNRAGWPLLGISITHASANVVRREVSDE